MKSYWGFAIVIFFACKSVQEKIIKPSYIHFKIEKNTLIVSAKNPLSCPTFITFNKGSLDTVIHINPFQEKVILKLQDTLPDTLKVLKKYNPIMKYGSYPFKKYDTSFNYGLPFSKGKRYKIMQGHFGKFSHNSNFSKYAIDFKMNVGQPVCAMRDGVVVAIKEDSNEGGKNKKYYDKANYILIYHKDGTFSQYVHLKQNGAAVEKNDSVKKGQIIGYSGNTGFSTAPHLHFGVFKPTTNGFVSIPYLLDSIPSEKYKKGKYAFNN
ncbi:M23 family metallopeptidase [Polaribacter sp. R77954]|uniref:M23 family metallopeptidase n=1 Tax=Polaribacter sp. R77954 TaxID=3093870 RepID=UPI0037C7B0C6